MRIGRIGWAVVLGMPVLSGCMHRHISLENPATSPSSRYSCPPRAAPCVPATTDVPGERNPSGMAFFALPRQCSGRIHKIVILKADTSTPEVDVTCAPFEDAPGGSAVSASDGPIGEMQ